MVKPVIGTKFVDVSHVVEHGMITYEGLPAPYICDFLSREDSRSHYTDGVEFNIGKITMVANTGTYLDSPFHRYPDGIDLSKLSLSSLANLDTVIIRVNHLNQRAYDKSLLSGLDVSGKAVLLHTGWDIHWRTEKYFVGNPYFTKDAAECLRDAGAALVGIDSLNIDDTGDSSRPVHSILLRAGIPIVEHLCNLQAVPDTGSKFFAVPVKVKNFGTFPVRAFSLCD